VVGRRLLPAGRSQREGPPGRDRRRLHIGDQRLPLRGLWTVVQAVVAQDRGQLVMPGGAPGARKSGPLQADVRVERDPVGSGEFGGLRRGHQ
jgi:hypothetical protein